MGVGAEKSERKKGGLGREGMPAVKTPFDQFLRFLEDAKF